MSEYQVQLLVAIIGTVPGLLAAAVAYLALRSSKAHRRHDQDEHERLHRALANGRHVPEEGEKS